MDEKVEERLKLNPLYSYAAQNWGYHARAALKEVIQLILDLLKSETKVSGCSQAMTLSPLLDLRRCRAPLSMGTRRW